MDSNTLFVARPAFLRRAPMKISILYLLATFHFFGVVIHDFIVIKFELAFFSLIFMTPIVDFLIESRTTKIMVTDRETILKRGVIFRRTKTILHEDVSSIEVIQICFDQKLDVGSIKILATGKSKVKISVAGIPAPFKLKELIESMR